jgi:parallel beta-helix repeat protein
MRLLLTILLLTSQAFAAGRPDFLKSINPYEINKKVARIKFYVPVTYYVTPTATGNGTGLDSANTISYAGILSRNLASGDIVLFKRGNTYNGQLNFPRNGVTYTWYSSGTPPLFNGFTTLSSWTNLSGNIYYTTVTVAQAKMQGLQIDGHLKAMGRYPNTGYLIYTSHSGNASITGTSVGALPSDFVGAELVIKKWRYILDRHLITSRSGNTLSFSTTNFAGNAGSDNPTDNNGYIIQNHLSTLDQDGEWSYDAAAQRLYVYFAGGPTGRTVRASLIDIMVPLNSTTGVTLNGLDFQGGNYGIQSNSTNNITVTNCNFTQQTTGIYAVSSNSFHMTGGSIIECTNAGFLGAGSDVGTTLDGVTVRNIGLFAGMGESGDGKYNGVSVFGGTTNIRNCVIKSVGFNGISFIGNDVLVENNLVDSACITKDDGANIYTFTLQGSGSSNRIIRNNIILNAIGAPEGAQWNGDPKGEAAGVYLDGDASNTIVSGNIIAHSPWGGMFLNGNYSNQFLNNTVFDCYYGMLITDNAATGTYGNARGNTITGNKFIALTAPQRAMWISFNNGVTHNPVDIGTFNNNYYSRPIDDNLVIGLARPNSSFIQNMTLATWKSQYGQDPNSVKSTVTATSVSDIRFDYNYSSASSSITLPGNFKDISNASYPGTLTLAPYDGRVLIYGSALVVPPTGQGYLIIKGRQVKVSF